MILAVNTTGELISSAIALRLILSSLKDCKATYIVALIPYSHAFENKINYLTQGEQDMNVGSFYPT
jgi:hypothetical protein